MYSTTSYNAQIPLLKILCSIQITFQNRLWSLCPPHTPDMKFHGFQSQTLNDQNRISPNRNLEFSYFLDQLLKNLKSTINALLIVKALHLLFSVSLVVAARQFWSIRKGVAVWLWKCWILIIEVLDGNGFLFQISIWLKKCWVLITERVGFWQNLLLHLICIWTNISITIIIEVLSRWCVICNLSEFFFPSFFLTGGFLEGKCNTKGMGDQRYKEIQFKAHL